MTRGLTSSAVMQQRHEPHNSLDDFPTPPWATRALCERLGDLSGLIARDPAANRGHMVKPLSERFADVEGSDIHDYGAGFPVRDYLFGPLPALVDWTITNPPFRLAEQFIWRMIATSLKGSAVFVRSQYTEGQDRYRSMFLKHKPMMVLQFTERVVLHKNKLIDPNSKVLVWSRKKQAFVWRKPSTATAYSWIVFGPTPAEKTEFDWIAPCRKRLERAGDYPAAAADAGAMESEALL